MLVAENQSLPFNFLEVADILAGNAPGKTDDKQIIFYKNQGGQGVIDIAPAKKLHELARE